MQGVNLGINAGSRIALGLNTAASLPPSTTPAVTLPAGVLPIQAQSPETLTTLTAQFSVTPGTVIPNPGEIDVSVYVQTNGSATYFQVGTTLHIPIQQSSPQQITFSSAGYENVSLLAGDNLVLVFEYQQPNAIFMTVTGLSAQLTFDVPVS